ILKWNIMKKRYEIHLQNDIILWMSINRPDLVIFSVPNESIPELLGSLEYKLKGNSILNIIRQVASIVLRKLINTGLLKGVSDLVVVLPQKVIFVELKQPKGVQSKFQKVFQNRVEKLGHEYYIVRSLEEFKLCISTK